MIKILYVEDEPFLAKIVQETLEQKDYEVIHIDDGAKALDTFQSHEVDICVLDIMLPNKNGFEIAKELRAITDVPILFLTAKNQTVDVVKAFDIGGNDYIKKPFSMEELMVRINNLLALSNKKAKSDLELSEYKIGEQYIFNPKRLQLRHSEKNKSLSHKETMILELLCKNKNEVTERKDILIKAWGDDSFYNSRNLDVYITKLRGYLSQDNKVKIVTLKGVGYQFLVE